MALPTFEDLARREQETAPQVSQRPSLVSSLNRGGLNAEASIRAGVAAPAQLLGATDFAASQLRQAGQLQAEADLYPAAPRFRDVTAGRASLGDFALQTIAEQGPNLAVSIGSAVGGGAAGSALRRLAPAVAGANAARTGAVAGAAGSSVAQNTGENFNALRREGGGSLDEQAATALVSGTAAGALDALPFIKVMDRLGLGQGARQAIRGSLGQRVARGAAAGALTEAPTEAAQQVIQRGALSFLNENVDLFDRETLLEALDAAAAGALVGGAMGGVAGGFEGALARGEPLFSGDARGPIGQRIQARRAQDEIGTVRSQLRSEVTPDVVNRVVETFVGNQPELDPRNPAFRPDRFDALTRAIGNFRLGRATDEEADLIQGVIPEQAWSLLGLLDENQFTQADPEQELPGLATDEDFDGETADEIVTEQPYQRTALEPDDQTDLSLLRPGPAGRVRTTDSTGVAALSSGQTTGAATAARNAAAANAAVRANADPVLGGTFAAPVIDESASLRYVELQQQLADLDARREAGQLDEFEMRNRNALAREMSDLDQKLRETGSPYTETDDQGNIVQTNAQYKDEDVLTYLSRSLKDQGMPKEARGQALRKRALQIAKDRKQLDDPRIARYQQALDEFNAARASKDSTRIVEAENALRAVSMEPLKYLRDVKVVSRSLLQKKGEPRDTYARPETAARYVKDDGKTGKLFPAHVPVVVNGVQRQYDVQGLIKQMIRDGAETSVDVKGSLVQQRIAEALSAIYNTPGIELDFNALPDDHVLFQRKKSVDGKALDITVGDFKRATLNTDEGRRKNYAFNRGPLEADDEFQSESGPEQLMEARNAPDPTLSGETPTGGTDLLSEEMDQLGGADTETDQATGERVEVRRSRDDTDPLRDLKLAAERRVGEAEKLAEQFNKAGAEARLKLYNDLRELLGLAPREALPTMVEKRVARIVKELQTQLKNARDRVKGLREPYEMLLETKRDVLTSVTDEEQRVMRSAQQTAREKERINNAPKPAGSNIAPMASTPTARVTPAEMAFAQDQLAQIIAAENATRLRQDQVAPGPEVGQAKPRLINASSGGPTAGIDPKLEPFMRELAEKFGLKNLRLVTDRDAMTAELDRVAEIAAARGADPKQANASRAQLTKGMIAGLHVTGDGETIIYVDPTLERHQQVETLAHELGHAIWRQLDVSPETAQEIRDAFMKWRETKGKSKASVQMSKGQFSAAQNWLGQTASGGIPSEYDLDFEEWFADNVGRWVVTDKKPKTLLDKFFSGVAQIVKSMQDMIRMFLGENTDAAKVDSSVAAMLNAIYDNSVRVKANLDNNNQRLRDWFPSTNASHIAAALNTGSPMAGSAFRNLFQQLLPEERAIVSRAFTQGTARLRLIKLLREDGHTHEADIIEAGSNVAMRKDGSLASAQSALGKALAEKRAQMRDQTVELTQAEREAVIIENTRLGSDIAFWRGYQYWADGKLKIGDQTETVMNKTRDMLARNLGVVRNDQRALAILDAATKGSLDALRAQNNGTFQPKNKAQEYVAQLGKLAPHINKATRAITVAASRLYETDNPVLIDFLNGIATRTGEYNRGASFTDARDQRRGAIERQFTDALVSMDDEIPASASRSERKAIEKTNRERHRELLKVMQNRTLDKNKQDVYGYTSADPKVMAAVPRLQAAFDWVARYGQDAGLNIRERGAYFPVVYDFSKVSERRQEWIDMLMDPDYAKDIESLSGKVFADEDARRTYVTAYVDRLIEFELEEDGKLPQTNVPFAAQTQASPLQFIRRKGKDQHKKLLVDSQQDDLIATLGVYARQISKKAEYTRRYGDRGQLLEEQLVRAKAYGATDEQVQLARDVLDAVLGTYKITTQQPFIHKVMKGIDYIAGTSLSADPRAWRRAQGLIITYQNVRLLAMATFASLSEVGGLLLRGDMQSSWAGLKAGAKEIARGLAGAPPSERRRLAELLGAIEHSIADDMVQQSYGAVTMSRKAQYLNSQFFRITGLTGWTTATRLAALEAGKSFISRLKGRTDGESDRLLAQLNLTREDIRLNEDGGLLIDVDPATLDGPDRKVAFALKRFVDESMLRPNATQRPLWGSNPDLAVFFHLKQFMFSAQERILRRIGNEAMEGNYRPIASMLVYGTIAVAVGAMLDEFRNPGEDDGGDEEDSPDAFDYAWAGASRAGLLGTSQLFLNMHRNATYGGTGFEDFGGPTVTQTANLARTIFGDRTWERTSIEALPGNNVLKGLYANGEFYLGLGDGQ